MAHPNPQNLIPGGKPWKKNQIYFDYQDIANTRLSSKLSMVNFFELDAQGRNKHKIQEVVYHMMDKLIAMALKPNLAAMKLVIEISNGRVPGSMQDAVTTLLEEGQNASYSQAIQFAQARLEDVYARIEHEFPTPSDEEGFVSPFVDRSGSV